jgi:hypothetical protein
MTGKKKPAGTNNQKCVSDRYLYVISFDGKYAKCGITTNIKRRMYDLKHTNNCEPTIHYTVKYNYRCCRCIEHGLLFRFEYFCIKYIDDAISAIKQSIAIIEKSPCGDQNKSHKGLSVYRFGKKCNCKFSDHASNLGFYASDKSSSTMF